MAKRKPTNNKLPTLADLLEDLQERGGYCQPWHAVKGGNFPMVMREALDSGLVELTSDNGLRLVDKSNRSDE